MAQNSIPLRVGIQITRSPFRELRETVGRRLKSFDSPKFTKPAVGAIRASVRAEFQGHYWATPEGGHRQWAPIRTPFGNRPAHAPLVASGAYFNAWMGGPGAIERVSGRKIEIGVSASRFPHAKHIRGGSGASISLTPLVIRAKKRSRNGHDYAMRLFLGLSFGVWMRRETLERGIKLIPRPHGTRNPALTQNLVNVAQDYVIRGESRLAA